MKTWMKVTLWSLLGLGAVFALGFYSLGWNAFFLPKQEAIRHDVYKQSQARIDGITRDLADHYDEWLKADVEYRETIRTVVIMKTANFDADHIENDKLRQWLVTMRGY